MQDEKCEEVKRAGICENVSLGDEAKKWAVVRREYRGLFFSNGKCKTMFV